MHINDFFITNDRRNFLIIDLLTSVDPIVVNIDGVTKRMNPGLEALQTDETSDPGGSTLEVPTNTMCNLKIGCR